MAKQKTEIEEAVIVTDPQVEETMIVSLFKEAAVLPAYIKKEDSLAAIRKAFEPLKDIVINGTKDKENYKKVEAGIKEMRTSRLAFDKSIDEFVLGPAKAWLDTEKEAFKAIIDEFKANELALKTKKDAIDQAKKDEKAAEEKKKMERMAGRLEKVIALGGAKQGNEYIFPYDITILLTAANVLDMEDADWENKVAEVQTAWDAEQKRISDEQEAADKLANENKAQAEANLATKRRLRLKELKIEGFTGALNTDGDEIMVKGSFSVTQNDIDQMEDHIWDAMILDAELEEDEAEEVVVEEKPITFPETAPIATTKAENYVAPLAEDDDVELPFDDDETELPFGTDPEELTPDEVELANNWVGTPVTEEPIAATETIASMVNQPASETAVMLKFSESNPYIQVAISPKFNQRIFPNVYRSLAIADVKVLHESQLAEGLSFVII